MVNKKSQIQQSLTSS